MEKDFDKVGIAVFNVNNGLEFHNPSEMEPAEHIHLERDWWNLFYYFMIYLYYPL